MQYLADKNHWRDTFKDQLNVNFKEWMLDAVAKNIENNQRSCTFKESLCDEQLATIGSTKDPIKRKVQFDLQKKEKFRMIESKDKSDMWCTVGVSENIIEASWIALVDAVEYKIHMDRGVIRSGGNS